MPKKPCCWATNELARDKENYILCSTRPKPDDGKEGKKKKGDKKLCCGPAFLLQQAKDAERDESEDLDAICGPSKKKKKGKKPKIVTDHFTANIICMKLYMPGREFDNLEQLKMKADICKRCKPIMYYDRINVNCLPCEPSSRFKMHRKCLDKELTEGITVSVIYKKREIARGCYVLPDAVILRIINSMEKVTHTAEVELTSKGCTVGMCTVRLSLQMHCENVEDGDDDGSTDTMMADSSLVGDTSSDPCQGFANTEEQSGDGFCSDNNMPTRRQGGSTKPAKMIDVAGPYSIYSCGDQDDGCIKVNAAPPGGQFSFPAQSHLGEGNTNRMCPQISAPELKQMGIKRARECPMCKEDVTWLPQISACPHCGYKPLPMFEEKPYDEKATAQDILVDFFEHMGSDPADGCYNDCENPQATDMRTEEAFETIIQDYKALKQSIKKCRSGTQPCPSTSQPAAKKPSTDLFTVFTELSKLCGEADTKDDKKARIKEICQEACKLSKSAKKNCASSKSKSNQACDPCEELKKRNKQKKRFKSQIISRLYGPMETFSHRRHGHAHCHEDERKVPAHMGWLWTHHPLAKRPGWRPGAIRRSIRELMGYFLKDFPVDTIPISKYRSYHKQKPKQPDEHCEKAADLKQVPTLHIEKKNDEFIITLRPLKDPVTLRRAANPYADMKPVQFRITKNPLLKQVRDLKRCLKNMGFSKCTCHRPVMRCYCRSFVDKKLLVDEVQRQCRQREMDNCEHDLVLSDTTDSEAEYDFGVTPPAGLMKPERLKTTHVTHTETQYNENDWAMPTMFPHPPNAHMQYGGCVIGERKGRFNWIFGKGNVHKKPKKPIMRNPPKKKPKRAFPGAPAPPVAKPPTFA